MRLSPILAVVLLVIAVGLGSGVATAQDGDQAQEEINNSLSEIETFIATTLGQIGIIVLLIGAAVWFFSGRRTDRAAWGWRAI